jgi:hypothetical protein
MNKDAGKVKQLSCVRHRQHPESPRQVRSSGRVDIWAEKGSALTFPMCPEGGSIGQGSGDRFPLPLQRGDSLSHHTPGGTVEALTPGQQTYEWTVHKMCLTQPTRGELLVNLAGVIN